MTPLRAMRGCSRPSNVERFFRATYRYGLNVGMATVGARAAWGFRCPA